MPTAHVACDCAQTLCNCNLTGRLLQDGPEDDDSWTTNGQADLEAELAHRQKELDSNVAKHAKRATRGLHDSGQAPEFDPSDMVAKLNVGCQNLMRLPGIASSVRCMHCVKSPHALQA